MCARRIIFAAIAAAALFPAPAMAAKSADPTLTPAEIKTLKDILKAPAPAETPAPAPASLPAPPPAAQVTVQPAPVTVVPSQPTGGFIDVSPIFGWLAPYIQATISSLLPILVGWLAWVLKQKTGIAISQSMQDMLTQGLKNRASSLIADGAVSLQGKTLHVDSRALANEANVLIQSMPQATRFFGLNLTPGVLADKIVDMIGQTEAGAAIIAGAHAQQASMPIAPDPGEKAGGPIG
jgi:hypothetical protein